MSMFFHNFHNIRYLERLTDIMSKHVTLEVHLEVNLEVHALKKPNESHQNDDYQDQSFNSMCL